MSGVSDAELDRNKQIIKLRLDVDYAYPSRLKSFIFTTLGIRAGKDYLKNSKIIARMINESKKNVKTYWFFTPTAIPDKETLELLNVEKHDIGLHVAANPYKELALLEKATNRKITYYTIHGTERVLARLMWRRKISEARASIPPDFPLKSFHVFTVIGVDRLCYNNPSKEAMQIVEDSIKKGEVLHFHPEWLFQRGTINRRGPYYSTLKQILQVDEDLNMLVVRKKLFFTIAYDAREYRRDFVPTDLFLKKLADRNIDVFTFVGRKWCCCIPQPGASWVEMEDNIALLQVKPYEEWLSIVGKKTRNMVRKSEKSGVKTEEVEPSEKLAEGAWRIYNETPIRQDRACPHYGTPLQDVRNMVFAAQSDTFLGAFLNEELIGFIQLVYGDKIAIVQQILSLQRHQDKAVNNALIAKAVQVCASRHIGWLMYGRIGNHPSLDRFKENNGFTKVVFPRYYIALTKKGRIAIRLGLHKELKDSLPIAIKTPLFPVFNWISRSKRQIRFRSPTKNIV